jgi:hypothetical protein
MLIAYYPIVKALHEEDATIANYDGKYGFFQDMLDAKSPKLPWINSIVSPKKSELDVFTRKIKRGNKYQGIVGPQDIVLLADLKLDIAWKQKGIASDRMQKGYKGVHMDKSSGSVEQAKTVSSIYRIEAKRGFHVHMAMGSLPADESTMTKTILKLHKESSKEGYAKLGQHFHFPEINMKVDNPLQWVKRASIMYRDDRYAVVDALQYNTLVLNPKGFKATSHTKISATKSLNRPVIVNKPFFVWVTHKKLDYPLLFGYVKKEFWVND